jgi:isoquinoline 1-oxidoreductase beta subunit
MPVAAAATRWAVKPTSAKPTTVACSVGPDESGSPWRTRQRRRKAADTEKPALKSPEEYKYIGKPLRRFDGGEEHRTAIFGIDVNVPDAAVAVLIRNPHFGGSLQSFDAAAARAAPGVIDIFDVNGAVAVVADTYWHAAKPRAQST